MELTPDQAAAADAIMAWLRGPGTVFALRGLAGTGKTSLLAVLHETLERPPVLTPTGRAAAVLRRKGVPATTIHAAIYQVLKTAEGVKWVLRKPPEERYPLAIVDEASMVNDTTLRDLCTIYTRVILVGDQGQLPPIEGRSPLAESRGFTLTTVLRQALDSGVIRTALALRGGASISDALRAGAGDVHARLPLEGEISDAWPLNDTTMLTGRNTDRVWLNRQVRASLGLHGPGIVPGDRLVCLTNGPGWCNGTVADVLKLGRAWAAEDLNGSEREFIDFTARRDDDTADEASVFVEQLDAPDKLDWIADAMRSSRYRSMLFQRGWCLTVHKAQGSEWPNVVVYGDGFGDRPAWRYTAATRARRTLFWAR